MARKNQVKSASLLLALLRHLHKAHSMVELKELSQQLNVDLKLLKQEIERLSCCGADEHSLLEIITAGNKAIVLQDIEELQQAVKLSDQELKALIIMLKLSGAEDNDTLYQRLICASQTPDLEAQKLLASIKTDHFGISQHMKSIGQAILQHKVLIFDYSSAKTSKQVLSRRAVEPKQLVCEQGVWYVEAWCRKAQGWRLFRLERMQNLMCSDEKFQSKKSYEQQESINKKLRSQHKALLAITQAEIFSLELWPGIEFVDYKNLSEEEQACVDLQYKLKKQVVSYARIPYFTSFWLVSKLISYGRAAVLLKPELLRQHIRQELQEKIDHAQKVYERYATNFSQDTQKS